MKTVKVDIMFFEHLLACLANQKFLHEWCVKNRKEGQVIIDKAWRKGMSILSANKRKGG